MDNIILAIETSCDETAAALYSPKRGLLGERVHSQERRHAAYGGVVPELAARDHLRRLLPLTDRLLRQTAVAPTIIAHTAGPGLAAALLVGAATAHALAAAWRLPIVAVNHLEGHLLSPLLSPNPPPFPYVALLISGGHTQLWLARAAGDYRLLGQTLDDAAGEAFDKIAAQIGLGYPGGAKLERLAGAADNADIRLPSPAQNDFDFSFSGLKTAARRLLGNHSPPNIAAALQRAIADGLAKQAAAALRQTGATRLAVVGGVAQNAFIAARLRQTAAGLGARLFRPKKRHCGDNAAMIAVAAALQKPRPPGGFDIFPKNRVGP